MTFVQGWYFNLAAEFAIMMYMLGFLLLAIPLPKAAGVKRYARGLIHESFGIIILVFILDVFLTIALGSQEIVGCAIGGDIAKGLGEACEGNIGVTSILDFSEYTYEVVWKAQERNVAFMTSTAWTTSMLVGTLQFVVAALAGGVSALTSIPLAAYAGLRAGASVAGQVASILGGASMVYGAALVGQSFLSYYVQFIYYNWGVLAALGVLLCMLPFKIGRRAGFFLIVFPVASYVMIPLQAFLSPIIAESVAGFVAGMGWGAVESYISPAAFSLAATPAMYFTFTTIAMGGLSMLSGASSIPIRGLQVNVGGFARSLSRMGARTGQRGTRATIATTKMAVTEARVAMRGGRELRRDRWLEGRTKEGRKFRVPVRLRRGMLSRWREGRIRDWEQLYEMSPAKAAEFLRDHALHIDRSKLRGVLTYPEMWRTPGGEVINVQREIEKGTLRLKESIRPHIRVRQAFKWGRDSVPAQVAYEMKRRGKLREAEGVVREDERGLREAYEDFAKDTKIRGPEAFLARSRAEQLYDTEPSVRAAWRRHLEPEGVREHTAEELRETFLDAYVAWKTGAYLTAEEEAFFRAHRLR